MAGRIVRALYSERRGTLLPSLMDGLTVMLCSLPLWLVWLGTSARFSINGDMVPPSAITIVTLVGYVGLTAINSAIVIRARRRSPHRTPLARSKHMTMLCVALALTLPTTISTMLFGPRSIGSLWDAFAALAFVAVPAAIRGTAPGTYAPKLGVAGPDSMRQFGVEPGNFNSEGYRYQGWRQEP